MGRMTPCTTLRTDEAVAIAGLFPGERGLSVLEGRTGEPFWYEVYPRPWAAGGAVVRDAPGPAGSGPVVSVTPSGAMTDAVRAALVEVAGRYPEVLVGEVGGPITRSGDRLPSPPVVPVSVRLTVEGAWRVELDVTRLPVVVRAVVPETDTRRCVRIDGQSAGPLPPAGWFHLDLPAGPAELELTVAPGFDGDQWSVRQNGREVGESIAAPVPAPPRRVILIVDRTCPDRDRWETARNLVRNIAPADTTTDAEKAETYFAGESGTRPPAPPADRAATAQAELNAAIRAGLADGFRTAFEEPVGVDLIWFADVPDDGLGRPEMAIPATQPFGREPYRCPSDGLDQVLPAAGYAPGLDLCDALEDAVRAAAHIAGEVRPTGVLIVGNSPPHRPTNPNHPFARMWRTLPRSSARKRGYFPDTLAALEKHGCPVVALFLAGHQVPPGFDSYGNVQAAVHEAFTQCLPVVSATADRAGVANGVRAAVRRLTDGVSGVRLERGPP